MGFIRSLFAIFLFCLITYSGFSQDAGVDQDVCGLTTTLAAADPDPDTGTWSVVGTPPGNVSFTDNTLYNTDVTVDTYGLYTFRWTVAGVGYDDVDITFYSDATITHTGGSNNQTLCVNTAITNITYSIGGSGNNASATGVPAGVYGTYNSGVFTISGTPTVSGTFNFTVNATGPCNSATAYGTITVSPDNTISLSSGAGTDNQTVCINTAITPITYTTTGATGANVTGLPAGVTGNWAADQVTISGTPSSSGNFNYTVTLTGGCGTVTAGGSIAVTAENTISLSSGAGTDNQTVCINTAITPITYTTTGATGANVTGLPAGVTGSWAADQVTISGAPSSSGNFNYTVTLTGGCGTVTAGGSIAVTAENTISLSSGAGTDNQTVCINTAIDNITYTTTGATGATFSGLPTGVTGSWSSDQVTISGTPTGSGSFGYTVTLTGGCGNTTAGGTIIVNPDATITLSSAAGTDSQTLCINTAITNIIYNIGGSGNGATVTGLPTGVNGTYSSGVFTISGTPTVSGTFNYTVTATGPCVEPTAQGTITVTPDATITLSSAAGTDSQTLCINTAITNIIYNIGGSGNGATVTGLPTGVTGTYSSGVFTISGTPTVSGTFNYTVTATGPCVEPTAQGTITVTPDATITLSSAAGTDSQTLCINTVITNITYNIGGSGNGATVTGLPTGVNGTYNSGVFTISGTPTVSGTFNYTVTATGPCVEPTAQGTITVTPDATITLTSGNNNQTLCINTALTNITYSIGGSGNGATVTGLPTGVNGTYSSGVFTISGTPTISGTFNYTVTATGPCGEPTNTGTITVNPLPAAAGPISGPTTFTPGTAGIEYSVSAIEDATSYTWSYSGTGVIINGSGPTITLNFSLAATPGQLTVKGTNSCGDGAESLLDILLGSRILYLTSVMLQGLYDNSGMMRQAWDTYGPRWEAGVADHITIELHSSSNYATIVYTAEDVPLSTNGAAIVTIPAIYDDSYYITIKHRNSIETTTAASVPFVSNTINQSFGSRSEVYGENLAESQDDYFLIYAGDVNQDGFIDTRDFIGVDNDSYNYLTGYLVTDVNGNGIIDTNDFIFIDNNNYNYIGTIHP